MYTRWTELRFARRLLTLFVTSALLPIGAVFLLSWFQVTDQLRDQSQQRLRQASKAVALALLGQLQARDAELAGYDPGGPVPPWRERLLRERFEALSFAPVRGPVRAVFGPALELPPLDGEDRRALAEGQPLLRVRPEGDLLIVRPVPGHVDPPDLLLATLDPAATFDLSESSVVPPNAEFCAFGPEGRLLSCSAGPAPLALPRGDEAQAFEWSHEGEDYLAQVYPLFLAGAFRAPSWRVLLSEPRSVVLAPMIAFRRALPLVALLSITLITLLCIRQIRARLGPLQRLQEGTRRIAERDFAVDLRVDSGDELQELAESFNTMAGRLQGQFHALTSLVEIDRRILEASEEQGVIETVLRELPRVYPCDAVLLVPVSDEGSEEEATAWYLLAARQEVRRAPVPGGRSGPVGPAEEGQLLLLADTPDPALGLLQELGMGAAVVLPMVVQGREIGRVALAHREAPPEVPEALVYAQRVVDQAAIAVRSIRVNEQNRMLAYFDSLTALPNRLLFRERTEQALLRARRKGTRFALCLLDLDGFKRVNDTWGHDAGDRLLESFAQRLLPLVRAGTLARLGGDEFTLLLPDLEQSEDAARVAERIVDVLREPFAIGHNEVIITASIGIAVFPDDGPDANTLLKHADVAMYHAKDLGRNNYQYFSVGLNEAAAHRMELEQALRGALEAEQLRVVYQPIFDPVTREVRGAEALVRWDHPEFGSVPSPVLVSVAEDTGAILPIGRWVLQTALEEARSWDDGVYVGVNLSQRQFRDADCTTMVRRALNASRLAPDRLVLELTESLLMNQGKDSLRKLSEIRVMGVRLAIDDFGTGYSSFAYLKDFPIQILKLDKEFIHGIETGREADAIVDAMIALGHKLDLRVVAEGVEREGQLARLVEQGCDLVQGFLLGKPLEAAEFRDLLRARRRS